MQIAREMSVMKAFTERLHMESNHLEVNCSCKFISKITMNSNVAT